MHITLAELLNGTRYVSGTSHLANMYTSLKGLWAASVTNSMNSCAVELVNYLKCGAIESKHSHHLSSQHSPCHLKHNLLLSPVYFELVNYQ